MTWDLVKSDLGPAAKKATVIEFDRVLGLGLASWQPRAETIPGEIMRLVDERQRARTERRFKDADVFRDQIRAQGYEVEDTPSGPHIRSRAMPGA